MYVRLIVLIFNFGDFYMKKSTLLLEPYLLGCLLGDGGLKGNLTFASNDLDVIDRVNDSLAQYQYFLKKRSNDPKRSSEYTITPMINNKNKYQYYFRGIPYESKELLSILPEHGYPVTNHDTLLSVLGLSPRYKTSTVLKYFPKLTEELTYVKLKETQNSNFIDILNALHLRCRSTEKRIPEIYFEANFEDRLLLFQGLMDTDGCGSDHRLDFCVANEGLADDFARLAESLGYRCSRAIRQPVYFNKKYQEYRKGKTAYRVRLDNIDTIEPFLCKRKIENYHKKREKRKKNGTITCGKIPPNNVK